MHGKRLNKWLFGFNYCSVHMLEHAHRHTFAEARGRSSERTSNTINELLNAFISHSTEPHHAFRLRIHIRCGGILISAMLDTDKCNAGAATAAIMALRVCTTAAKLHKNYI